MRYPKLWDKHIPCQEKAELDLETAWMLEVTMMECEITITNMIKDH